MLNVYSLVTVVSLQREFHLNSLYCDQSNNGAQLYSSATYVAVPYNVTNRKLTSMNLQTSYH